MDALLVGYSYMMAEDCADDDDDKASISELQKAAKEELNLHNSLAEVWYAISLLCFAELCYFLRSNHLLYFLLNNLPFF